MKIGEKLITPKIIWTKVVDGPFKKVRRKIIGSDIILFDGGNQIVNILID